SVGESLRPLRQVAIGTKSSPAPGEVRDINLRIGQRLGNRTVNDSNPSWIATDERGESPSGIHAHAQDRRSILCQGTGSLEQRHGERRAARGPGDEGLVEECLERFRSVRRGGAVDGDTETLSRFFDRTPDKECPA